MYDMGQCLSTSTGRKSETSSQPLYRSMGVTRLYCRWLRRLASPERSSDKSPTSDTSSSSNFSSVSSSESMSDWLHSPSEKAPSSSSSSDKYPLLLFPRRARDEDRFGRNLSTVFHRIAKNDASMVSDVQQRLVSKKQTEFSCTCSLHLCDVQLALFDPRFSFSQLLHALIQRHSVLCKATMVHQFSQLFSKQTASTSNQSPNTSISAHTDKRVPA